MKRCPQCRSAEITFYTGGYFGKYECKKCGYIGVLVIDEPAPKAKPRRRKAAS